MEGIAASTEKHLQSVGHIASSKVDSVSGVRDRIAFKYCAGVAHTVSTVKHHSTCHSTGVQTEHGLLLKVKSRHAESLKENLSGMDAVVNIVVWRLSEEDRMLFRVDVQLLKNVSPNLFHVVPVSNFALNAPMFNRVS